MNVKSLREMLSEATGKLSPPDVELLDNALRPLDDLTLSELCAKLAKIKIPKAKARMVADQAIVSRYLDELASSHRDSMTFKAVLERLKADRAVKVREAMLIAQAFLGDQQAYKSKPLALKAIAARQLADERVSSRKDKVSDIF
jgi:hypothetical protein